MALKLPELNYAYDALEPVIDRQTVEIHYSKHHQAYVNNLVKALEGTELENAGCFCEVLKNLDKVPQEKFNAVKNNGGGAFNHKLYWMIMTPGGSKEPQGALKEAIERDFGSFDAFKEEFEKAGLARFGSGWVWLAEKDNKLVVLTTANQDCPVSEGYHVLLGNDVWEHAYYLNYQNRRADYLKAWWNLLNWDIIGKRFEK